MSIMRFLLGATVGAISIAASAQANNAWTYHESDDAIGRVYYYERTNSDGSMDERVTVFRRDATHIEVYKENGLCHRAALVTAELDLETLSAPVITGGALQPGAKHIEFAFLELNPETGVVEMLVQLPDMEIRNDVEIETANWTLFDFDLASFTVATPHLDNPENGFGFGMALMWADPSMADPLFWMGELTAEHVVFASVCMLRAMHIRRVVKPVHPFECRVLDFDDISYPATRNVRKCVEVNVGLSLARLSKPALKKAYQIGPRLCRQRQIPDFPGAPVDRRPLP